MLPLPLMVDETLIGERVGAGLQHTVFMYGDDRVIKIPHLWMRLSATLEQKQKELETVKEYLGDYLPETHVMKFKNSYCYVQEYISDLKPLTVSHAEKHRPALTHFLKQNQTLIREQKLAVDLLGGKAYLHILSEHHHKEPTLSGNIVVQDDLQKLRLLDTDMLRASLFNISHPREIGFLLISFAGHLLTTFTIKHFRIFH